MKEVFDFESIKNKTIGLLIKDLQIISILS